jgi:hypothetical protein
MGLPHSGVDFSALVAVGFYLGQALHVATNDERQWVLLLRMLEQIVEDDYLVDLLAVRVVTLLNVLPHLGRNSHPLLLD